MNLENGIMVLVISLFVVYRSFVFIQRRNEAEKHRLEIKEILDKMSEIELSPISVTAHVNSFTESRWCELIESIKKPLTKEQETLITKLVGERTTA